jgi:hypothetical protein
MHVLVIECHAGCAYLPKVLKSVESTYICQKTHMQLSAHGLLSRTTEGTDVLAAADAANHAHIDRMMSTLV